MPVRATLVLLALALPVTANAQPLGSFRWQLQPYCSVIPVNVTQQGGIHILDGTDTTAVAGTNPATPWASPV